MYSGDLRIFTEKTYALGLLDFQGMANLSSHSRVDTQVRHHGNLFSCRCLRIFTEKTYEVWRRYIKLNKATLDEDKKKKCGLKNTELCR
jgi:hypothetical protein